MPTNKLDKDLETLLEQTYWEYLEIVGHSSDPTSISYMDHYRGLWRELKDRNRKNQESP